MNELKKTAIFAGVALLLLATAVWATLPGSDSARDFRDQGGKFFPEFTLPEQARALEVVEYDPSTGSAEPFKVAMVDGRWVIPSHYDYPADAKDRLARTAAGIIDLTKDTIRSDRPEDHKAMGVLDPLNPKVASPEGLGTRVTLKDQSGEPLADLILGKDVPGAEGQRFVRVPGQNRVYGVKLDGVEISTRFSDWIETNLLQVEPAEIRRVAIDNHKVDPEAGTLSYGEVLELSRPDDGGTWTLKEGVPEGKELNSTALSDLTSTLGNLRIAGVRPKPAGLTASLKSSTEGGIQLNGQAVTSLASKGFHLVQGQLVSNEGDVHATTGDGVVLTLRFGEVTFARGEELSAGSRDDEATAEVAAPSAADEATPEGAVESRYLFVTAAFDPNLVPKPAPPEPWAGGEIPDDPFARTPAERQAQAEAEKAEADRLAADYDARLKAGQEKASELSDRFAAWYYVVPGDAYRKVVLDREALTRDKSAAPPTPGGLPPGFPGGAGGLPPGLPNIPGLGAPGR